MSNVPIFSTENLRIVFDLLMEDLPKSFLSFLQNSYDQVYNTHCLATGSDMYLVGTEVFCAKQEVKPISGVRLYYADPSRLRRLKLDDDLMPLHIEWYAKFREHRETWQRIRQAISSLSMRATNWQDIRDMFPDHFLRLFLDGNPFQQQDIQNPLSLPRTRESLYPDPDVDRLQHWSPNLVRMYDSISTKIDTYVGYKLL